MAIPRDLDGALVYAQYRVSAAIGERLPIQAGEALASVVGRITARTMRSHRRLVERHQRRVAPPRTRRELDERVRHVFQNYARYWYELFRVPVWARGAIEGQMVTVGFHRVVEALERGTGAILALPHLGAWDFAGAWLAARGYPPVVVAEVVEPPELFEWFVRQREEIGMTVVPLDAQAGNAVAKALRANRVVCLLCDRDLGGDGVPVELFGAPTTMPAGPALLALRTGAPLMPSGVYLRPRGQHWARMMAPIECERRGRLRDDVERITQDLASRFEELIRSEPEQWLMMQPNWPDDGVAP